MYCPQCGAANMESYAYCANCGSPLISSVPDAENASAASPLVFETPAAPGVPMPIASDAASGSAPAPAMVPVPAPAPAPKGCLRQAWSDITGSANWLRRVLLLTVMSCVPVLDLYASGYCLQWGAQAARGNNEPLPTACFDKRTILSGLVPLLLGFLCSLGAGVLYVFSIIPLIGLAVTLAGAIFAYVFCTLAIMRVGTTGKLGSAFDLSELFRVYRKNLGSLVSSAFVPGLIGYGIVALLVLAFMIMVGFAAYTTVESVPYAYDMYDYYDFYGYDHFDYLMSAFAEVLLAVVGFFAAVSFLCSLVKGIVDLWTMRAVGHWIHRNAPEWAAEIEKKE